MEHQAFLERALALANRRRGFCSPNPAVGAVLVKEGVVIAEGYHFAAGEPHAEAMALLSVSPEMAKGASLYVSLEPCNHWGRTPPCSDLIIDYGVAQLYFGYADPNPVAGGGLEKLLSAGVFCAHCPSPEIDAFYRSYTYWLRTGLPWVSAKLALSLDGKMAGSEGEPIQLTGPELQKFTHLNRLQSDAILSTVQTILCDDPQLNVRLDGNVNPIAKPVYLMDRLLEIPADARIFHTASALTIFHGAAASPSVVETLQHRGVHCVLIHQDAQDHLDLAEIICSIGKAGVQDLWVEAGGALFTALHEKDLVQRQLFYIAPRCLGPKATAAFHVPLDFSQKNVNIAWSYSAQDAICEITTLLDNHVQFQSI